jgi:alanyl-tRNA synthetase
MTDRLKQYEKVKTAISDYNRTTVNDTASHVLKGAIVFVLGKQCLKTEKLLFTGKTSGILTVSYSTDEKPTDDQISAIEEHAMKMISENTPLHIVSCSRLLAYQQYGIITDHYNHSVDTDELSIVTIDGCPSSACNGSHLQSVGALQYISINKIKHVKNKLLEFEFYVDGHRYQSDTEAETIQFIGDTANEMVTLDDFSQQPNESNDKPSNETPKEVSDTSSDTKSNEAKEPKRINEVIVKKFPHENPYTKYIKKPAPVEEKGGLSRLSHNIKCVIF